MNQLDALRLMVRNYPGGYDAVALRLGKSRNTLEKELGNSPDHKLGVIDACAISGMCIEVSSLHCRAYATAVAAECGGFVALPVRELPAPPRAADLTTDTAGLVRECSEVLSKVVAHLADGKLTDAELRDLERELNAVDSMSQQVRRDAREVHAACKARAQQGPGRA